MWGQETLVGLFREEIRIIPTRVGTRAVNQLRHSLHKDHPHACGDKSACFVLAKSVVGSSPRVWGQAVDEEVNS